VEPVVKFEKLAHKHKTLQSGDWSEQSFFKIKGSIEVIEPTRELKVYKVKSKYLKKLITSL